MAKLGRSGGTAASAAVVTAFLVLALGGYYYQRSNTNADRLAERNLRELDRIGRTIELRVNNFESIMAGLAKAAARGELQSKAQLVPGLSVYCPDQRDESTCSAARERLREEDQDHVRLELGVGELLFYSPPRLEFVKAGWRLSELERIARSSLFDQVFLADESESDEVFLSVGRVSGLRLHQIPSADPPKKSEEAPAPGVEQRISKFQPVTVAGKSHLLFRQPLDIDLLSPAGPGTRWVLGAVVSKAGFRAETLAFDSPHLLFLSLLLAVSVLALPFLRVALMGPRERLEVRDILFLGLSLVLASGLIGISLADLNYYWNLRQAIDTQLEQVADRLEANLAQEIERGLGELDRQSEHFRAQWDDDNGLGENLPAELPTDQPWLETNVPARSGFPHFVMVFWTDAQGRQIAKWTRGESNTPRVPVGKRPYHSRIRDGTGWALPAALRDGLEPTAPAVDRYFLQSIHSLTTGEHQGVLSRSFCWSESETSGTCPPEQLGAAVMLVPPLSLRQPVLPPGFEFAVIDADGRTQFHSRSERNLEESFFDETDRNPLLRSAVAARSERRLHAKYMGRPNRLYVRPVSNTAYSLVVALDQSLLGTVNVESLFLAAAEFGIYAWAFFLVFALVESRLPKRLVWAWPDLERPDKHKLQVKVYLVFVVSLVLQVALSAHHATSLLVPFQALGLGLVASARGDGSPGRTTFSGLRWLGSGSLGWAVTALATLVLLGIQLAAPSTGSVLLIQVAAAVLAVWMVLPGGTEPSSGARDANTEARGIAERSYSAASLLFMVVIAVLPGYLIFQRVFESHLELLVRYQQVEIHEALESRARDDRGVGETLDLAFEPFFDTSVAEPVEGTSSEPKSELDSGVESEPMPARSLQSWTVDRIPFVSEVAVKMRHLAEASDRYEWQRTTANGGLALQGPSFRITSTHPPHLGWPTWQFWAGLLLGLPLLGWLANWLGRRVFLAKLSHATAVSLSAYLPEASEEPGPNRLFVCTRSTARESLADDKRVHYISLIANFHAGKLVVPRASDKKIVCIDFFDHRFEEPSWNEKLLAFVEEVAYASDKVLVLLTSYEPEDLLARVPGEAGESSAAAPRALRWTRVLGRFVTIHVAELTADCAVGDPTLSAAPEGGTGCSLRLRRLLRQECAGFRQLEASARQILRRPDCETLTEDALIDQMRELAEGYYRAVWTILRREERLVLAQLAAGAVVNPKSEEAIRHLLARRLLVRRPELSLMNRSFARFVSETAPASDIAAWERQGTASAWQQLRFPIFIVLVAAIAFLGITQQELVSTATALVSAVVVGAGGLLRLFSLLQPRAPQPEAAK